LKYEGLFVIAQIFELRFRVDNLLCSSHHVLDIESSNDCEGDIDQERENSPLHRLIDVLVLVGEVDLIAEHVDDFEALLADPPFTQF
jgi:hypothetical protein